MWQYQILKLILNSIYLVEDRVLQTMVVFTSSLYLMISSTFTIVSRILHLAVLFWVLVWLNFKYSLFWTNFIQTYPKNFTILNFSVLTLYIWSYAINTSHLRTNDPWFLFRFWFIIIFFIRLFKVFLICLISSIITTWRVFFKVEFCFLFRFFIRFQLFFNLRWWAVNIIITDLRGFCFLITDILHDQITVTWRLVNQWNSMKQLESRKVFRTPVNHL